MERSQIKIYGRTHLVGPDDRCVWCEQRVVPSDPRLRWVIGSYVVDRTDFSLNTLSGKYLWWPCTAEAVRHEA